MTVRAERSASYALARYQLVEPPAPTKGAYRAQITLFDAHPAPLAWLTFWEEADFNPEQHWNREADLERCPKCYPQYELHFRVKELPEMLEKLKRLGGNAKLTFRSDRWSIEE